MKKCSHCGSTENLLIHTRAKNNKKETFYCRECNRMFCKAYRDSVKGRKRVNQAVYRSVKKYPDRQRARVMLNYYVKKGYIFKPISCKCGNLKVEAHHNDYSKPLEVLWLCRSCHSDLHKTVDNFMV